MYFVAGVIKGQTGAVIGWTEKGSVGTEVGVEVDLRSSKREERSIRFFVDGKIQKTSIAGVGRGVRFGVCPNTIVLFLSFFLFCYD